MLRTRLMYGLLAAGVAAGLLAAVLATAAGPPPKEDPERPQPAPAAAQKTVPRERAERDIADGRELTVNGTRVVLLRVAKETQLTDKQDGKPAVPLRYARVTFVMEWLGEGEVRTANHGGKDLQRAGGGETLFPPDGSRATHVVHHAYKGFDRRWLHADAEWVTVKSPEKARAVEVAFNLSGLRPEGIPPKVDVVLGGLGFNDRVADFVFRNIPLE